MLLFLGVSAVLKVAQYGTLNIAAKACSLKVRRNTTAKVSRADQ